MTDERPSHPTPPEQPPEPQRKAEVYFRRAVMTIVALVVIAGLLGAFGVRSGTAEASGGGYDLRVSFARITRPGLATPLEVEVSSPRGFMSPVTIALTQDYAEMFEQVTVQPQPMSATSDGTFLVWQFDPPTGDTLRVSLGGRLGSSTSTPHTGKAVLRDGDRAVTQVEFRTFVMP